MSKKKKEPVEQYVDLDAGIDLRDLTKKDLKDLERQLEIQTKVLELERNEIQLEASRLSFQSQMDKRRFDARGIADGVLHINDEIREASVDFWTTKVDSFVHVHQDFPSKKKPGLTLIINSPGGSVFEGWRLFDELRAASLAGHKVTTKVRGVAASMAAVLAQAGDHRIIGPESYMMIHEPSTWTSGKAFEIKDAARLVDRLNDQIAKTFARQSGKTEKAMKLLFERTDAWFSAEECVKHGFADEIG